ncbi:hypothetical protein DQX05_21645 [Paenibacillus thiaminolyticus]|uniref:Uncharacterized protein n=1 Tax=Paenibacillus thiaminolyticus TaxID=49283 RepID=A0A3A3GCN5_PANTH|nr:hypothetical protein DQX05_21645 [Paenibacillus thiaminolyticus]
MAALRPSQPDNGWTDGNGPFNEPSEDKAMSRNVHRDDATIQVFGTGSNPNYSAYRSAIRAFPPPEAVLRWISQSSSRLAGQREAGLRKQAGRPEQGDISFCCLLRGAGRPAAECCLYFSGNSSCCRELRCVLSLAYASYRFVRYVV